jgi:hypothetical protein
MRRPAIATAIGLSLPLLLPAGCRPGTTSGPGGAGPAPGDQPAARPVDLTAALGATWTAKAQPVGEASGGDHADFRLTVTVEVRNTASARVEAGRAGQLVLEAPNLEVTPLELTEFGGFSIDGGGTKTLKYEDTYRARVQGRKLYLRDLRVRAACTAPLSVAGVRGERAVVVGRFDTLPGGGEGKAEVWPLSEGFLRVKAGGRDEWTARLATKLLEEHSAP